MPKNDTAEAQTSPTRVIPLSDWPKHHPWPTASGMRFYVYNAKMNGMEKYRVVKRVGRRVLIDEAAFFRWVDSEPQSAA